MKKYQGSYLSYFLMYMFYYLSMALFSVLISVYLMDKGYKASEVSLVVSCSFILSMITQPFIGNLCNRYDKKKVNGLLLMVAGIFGIMFIFVHNIYMIAIVYSAVLAILNGVNPIIERMATVSKHKYGLIRIWGTIGYASGSQVSGLIYRYISPEAMYLFFERSWLALPVISGVRAKLSTTMVLKIPAPDFSAFANFASAHHTLYYSKMIDAH